jgi:pSer/pThr/pTyr-binding forkhead associated (FHA) protein
MKLIFPNGEHGAVQLGPGRNRIGAAPEALIRLDAEGVLHAHCELELAGERVLLRFAAGEAQVVVNGQPGEEGQHLRAGDSLSIGSVAARLVAVERLPGSPGGKAAQVDDAGATRVRAALPKYVLRGVSGAAFGKTFPIASSQVIGRHHECDISVPSEEISRRHAQVKPTPDGLLVEDLGSSNGTFINGTRVQTGILKNGDELRLDAIRFLLVVPGREMPKAAPAPAPAPAKSGGTALVFGVITAIVVIAVAAAFLLR